MADGEYLSDVVTAVPAPSLGAQVMGVAFGVGPRLAAPIRCEKTHNSGTGHGGGFNTIVIDKHGGFG